MTKSITTSNVKSLQRNFCWQTGLAHVHSWKGENPAFLQAGLSLSVLSVTLSPSDLRLHSLVQLSVPLGDCRELGQPVHAQAKPIWGSVQAVNTPLTPLTVIINHPPLQEASGKRPERITHICGGFGEVRPWGWPRRRWEAAAQNTGLFVHSPWDEQSHRAAELK